MVDYREDSMEDFQSVTTLINILKTGGPVVTAALFFWLYLHERRYAQALNDKILDLAVRSAENTAEQTGALMALREVIVSFGKNLKGGS